MNQNGFLLINKPSGITSFLVCQKVKHHFHFKKVGHCGTLDPAATGLLVLAINEATKFVRYLLNQDKEYVATATLWSQTTTFDAEGQVLKQIAPLDRFMITENQLKQVFNKFSGNFFQIPPIYSAIKINGARMYKKARKGEVIHPEPRAVVIKWIKLLSFDNDQFKIEVHCSKGTYIRSLINDIGVELKSFAYLANLKRTKIGTLLLKNAIPITELFKQNSISKNSSFFLQIDQCLAFPKVDINSEKIITKLQNGLSVSYNHNFAKQSILKLYFKGTFLGLITVVEQNKIKAKRLLSKESWI